ncbi:hypothetical protein PAT3040_03541 [Paenibacillus agaridevorans]|uniref:Glycosyl hydrolase family 4 C-terminal domain-containing protein n=1 Tax=Paenibacillus agaridevorans TaxID=171404 RepID=A0A2R5EQD9_9BACL|nr:alpha-glucosidase/alpha-galactosidase [Paenibacillus agaridevorans]GBG08926.1 hypothetical protein PAT3040_03541 [Paenibacillus agaridevorans]
MTEQQAVRTNLNIAYIGGGSRGWAWGLMSDLASEPTMSGIVKLYDINQQAAEDNAAIGNSIYDRDEVKGKWKYEAVPSLEQALQDADFIIISILPGSFAEMYSDVHLPEEYGIYQSVGDTVGPGGHVRALRTIPIYAELAEHIKQHAPHAWVINFTNPMTLCVRTLYEVFPGIKAIGCCHEVFGTQKLLAQMLKEMKGIEDVQHRTEINVNVMGINHFTWIDKASYKGIDLLPLYAEFADKYYREGYEEHHYGPWHENVFRSAHRIHFDLFKKFGVIAAAGDRHLAEFMPGYWYLKDRETIARWKFSITPVDLRIEKGEKLFQQSKRLVTGEEAFNLKKTGEETIAIMKALLGIKEFVTNVNIPNQGQLGNVKHGAVVETNAYLSLNSVRPVMAGELPSQVNSMVNRHVYNQETILRAALTKDRELGFAAFANDPLVTIAPEQAKDLYNKMLDNTKKYAPYG